MSATSALLVGSPLCRTDAASQSRSTPNGEQLVPQELALPVTVLIARTQDLPPLVDFQTSACRGAPSLLPARLQAYTAPVWSVVTQSSPLALSAVAVGFQVRPRSVDR